MSSINNLDELNLNQQSTNLWKKLKSKKTWDANLVPHKYTLNDTIFEMGSKMWMNHIIFNSNFTKKLEVILTKLKDIDKNKSIIDKNKSIIEISEELYKDIVLYDKLWNIRDNTHNLKVDLSPHTNLLNTKMRFYKCTNIDNLIKFFNNILLTINRDISVDITEVDNKFNTHSNKKLNTYNIIKLYESIPPVYIQPIYIQPVVSSLPKPILHVHLFDISRTHTITPIDTPIYEKNIQNSTNLNPFADSSNTWITYKNTVLTNIWGILADIIKLDYNIKSGPGSNPVNKPKLQVKIFNEAFLEGLFKDMVKMYKSLYNSHLYEKTKTFDSNYFIQDIDAIIEEIKTPNNETSNRTTFYQKVIISDSNPKVCIIGDIHSSMHSLCDILKRIKDQGYFINDTFKLLSDRYIIFLGDIVDRGPFSIELLAIISILKLENINNVFIINGNHEESEIYWRDGLGTELINEYTPPQSTQYEKKRIEITKSVWFYFLLYLPSCIILEYKGEKYHLCHGSFDTLLLSQPKYKNEFISFVNDTQNLSIAAVVPRPATSSGKFDYTQYSGNTGEQLQWNDMNGTDYKYLKHNTKRGIGVIIPKPLIKKYLTTYGLKSILSGHQDSINIGCIFKSQTELTDWEESTHGHYANYELYKQKHPRPEDQIVLIPDDLAALVTSTATYSKPDPIELNKNCYLELT